MRISKDTVVCISLAKKAGNFGTTVYNHVFQKLNLDFLYKSFSTNDIVSAINGARSIGIRGISITMPYKTRVLDLVDSVSEEAAMTRSVNTIVNNDGVLTAYNTDVDSTSTLLEEVENKEMLYVLGAGGFSKAVQYSGSHLFDNVKIITRENWELVKNIKEGVVFNCTPIKGLTFKSSDVTFIDCDVASDTGKRLAILQAARQFKLYTGVEFLTSYVMENLDDILKENNK